MGTFATGVTVVTTAVDEYLHGLTANSVTALSLDPTLCLVCVDKRANGHGELRRAASFGVNILAAGQQDVSNTFAVSGKPEKGELRGVAYRLGTTGAPILDGVMAYLECRRVNELDGGDHTIFVGEAVAGEVLSDVAPLLFYRGRYRGISE